MTLGVLIDARRVSFCLLSSSTSFLDMSSSLPNALLHSRTLKLLHRPISIEDRNDAFYLALRRVVGTRKTKEFRMQDGSGRVDVLGRREGIDTTTGPVEESSA